MQEIETWRVKELSLVLQQMSELLKQGNNYEWANVFLHFLTESQNVLCKNKLHADQLKKLIQNIKNCFHSNSTLRHLVLSKEGSPPGFDINQEFLRTRARLLRILGDMEERMIEYIH